MTARKRKSPGSGQLPGLENSKTTPLERSSTFTPSLVDCTIRRCDVYRGIRPVPGTIVKCTLCAHEVRCFGQRDQSVQRGLTLMRSECPRGPGHNFYVRRENK